MTMPLPTRPGHVHCYLLPVDGGYMLVDTGLGLPDAKDAWAAELARLDEPVVTIFLTHFHPDHLGAAADLRELTGARVCQGRIDAEQSELVWQNDGWSDALADWFHLNGVPEARDRGADRAGAAVPALPEDGHGSRAGRRTATSSTAGSSWPPRDTPTAS